MDFCLPQYVLCFGTVESRDGGTSSETCVLNRGDVKLGNFWTF